MAQVVDGLHRRTEMVGQLGGPEDRVQPGDGALDFAHALQVREPSPGFSSRTERGDRLDKEKIRRSVTLRRILAELPFISPRYGSEILD